MLVHGGSKVGALGNRKTCGKVFEVHGGVWYEIFEDDEDKL